MQKINHRINIKKQKNRIKLFIYKKFNLFSTDFYLKALESGRITEKQLENIRRLLKRKLKFKRKRIKFLIKSRFNLLIKCNYPLSKKPSEIRMGKGKGSVNKYIARIKAGQILIKIKSLLDKKKIIKIFNIIKSKLGLQSKIFRNKI